MRGYLSKLRDEAAIQVKAPYSDSGATPNEIKFIEGAYQPPQPKKKKHAERARFRQLPQRRQKETANNNAAPPAGVPTLDQVNAQKTPPTEVAGSKTEKPGKREKIRFGQAPRETLPAGPTREVDAGAGAPSAAGSTQQVAVNAAPADTVMTNAAGEVINNTETEKPKKTRFSDRMRETKQKQAQDKVAKKKQKFVAPTLTPEQLTEQKQQQSALGLNGDTTKQKKPNPAKNGPKRRMGDKGGDQETDTGTAPATPPPQAPPPATPPAAQPQL